MSENKESSLRQEKLKLYQKLKSYRRGDIYRLLNSDLPEITYHIEYVIPEMQICCIYGSMGQFKSSLCLYFALCLATNKDTFHYKTKRQSNVLWIDEEMGLQGLKDKVKKLIVGNGIDIEKLKGHFFYESINSIKLDNDKSIELLKTLIHTHNIDIIFIDSISKVMGGDENRAQDVSKLHYNMRKLCQELAVSFVIIHHTRKVDNKTDGKKKKSIDLLRGSSDFGNQVDIAFYLESYGKNKYALTQKKTRYSTTPAINFGVDTDQDDDDSYMTLNYLGLLEDNIKEAYAEKMEKLKTDILQWMDENLKEEYSLNKDLVKEFNKQGTTKDNIRDAIYRNDKLSLVAEGQVEYNGYGIVKRLKNFGIKKVG